MRMLYIGTGPGPKNVMVQEDDGRLVVMTYSNFKQRRTEQMAEYASVIGEVQQFPERPVVREREVNGQTLREFTIKTYTSGKLVGISVWPEFPEFEVEAGSIVSASGKYTVNESKGTTYYNLTANKMAIVAPISAPKREVVNAQTEETPF